MIQFDHLVCGELDAALGREWLETNGLGGFASSTIVGLNTRRYHGLLVAALRPPVDRHLLLSKLEESVLVGERRYELSANEYPGAIHPHGHRCLRRFRLDPFPVLSYEIEGITLEKSIFMLHGEHTTVVQYTVQRSNQDRDLRERPADPSLRLVVRPLIAFRDFHDLTHENRAIDATVGIREHRASIQPYRGLPSLHFSHDGDELDPAGYWYRRLQYRIERERGLDFEEDLFSPFALTFHLDDRSSATIVASLEPFDLGSVERRRQAEVERRRSIRSAVPARDELAQSLAAAADQFVVARGDGTSVIAGYHWFGDWGRDTMIALPGLTWLAGRADLARRILVEFARYVDQGMIPNRFPDQGATPEYNTVDATLWFVEAIRGFLEHTGEDELVRTHFYGVLVDILAWHERGTRYGIRLDDDGLLIAGGAGTQLTWMDARIGERVATPRHGKPVEIQALWYNAVRTIEMLARHYGDAERAARCRAIHMRARPSFVSRFWNADAGCLYDVIDRDGAVDASIRPNQILAVGLPYSMLTRERAASVVDVVERQLLTPYGLRTLAPTDPHYHGRYEGDVATRDARYHQGAAWPWLMGPFITAYLKVHRRSAPARRRVDGWLAPLRSHLLHAGLGHVSELFDGDPPHAPRGCIAQAWSIAEILRAAATSGAFAGSPR
jgi:predicted glycogen debranching enzyme